MQTHDTQTLNVARARAALGVGAAHAVAIALGLGLVWVVSLCRASTDTCELDGIAFLALFAAGAAAATLLISVPVARRLIYKRFGSTTRALWRYLIVTVGWRFLFVIPPLWVLGLIDLAIIDAAFPEAPALLFIATASVIHGLGAALFALISLRAASNRDRDR